jgi:hypothetical protein
VEISVDLLLKKYRIRLEKIIEPILRKNRIAIAISEIIAI